MTAEVVRRVQHAFVIVNTSEADHFGVGMQMILVFDIDIHT